MLEGEIASSELKYIFWNHFKIFFFSCVLFSHSVLSHSAHSIFSSFHSHLTLPPTRPHAAALHSHKYMLTKQFRRLFKRSLSRFESFLCRFLKVSSLAKEEKKKNGSFRPAPTTTPKNSLSASTTKFCRVTARSCDALRPSEHHTRAREPRNIIKHTTEGEGRI